MDPDKEFAKLLSEWGKTEEMVEGITYLVKMIGTYYTSAVAMGLDERIAITLAMAYQSDLVRGAFADEDEKEPEQYPTMPDDTEEDEG